MEVGDPQSEGPPKLRLKVVAGNAVGRVIEVAQELTIGRFAEGEGTLEADIEISRRHARIAGEPDGRFLIEDLGSTNGTYVNGRRLDRPTALEAGDRVELGASALVVQVSAPQPTPRSSDTIVPGSSGEASQGERASGPEADAAPEAAVAADPAPSAPPPNLVLRIEVDLAAGRASVTLDESSEAVRLVHEDGRWRFA